MRVVLTPPKGNHVEASVDISRGRLSLSVKHGDTTLLQPSRLGVKTTHADLTTGLQLVRQSTRTVRDTYETTTGRRREHTYTARETTFRLSKGDHRIDLQVRVSNDGIAYRYVLHWSGPVTVMEELSEYVVPRDAEAILLPYDNGRYDYETIHDHTTVGKATPDVYGYPALFGVDGSWLLVTESDLDSRYAGSFLTLDDQKFHLTLPDPYVTGPSPLATPWRTMIVGDLATVVESDLVTSLAAPTTLENTDWIKPGRAAWSWWSDGPSSRDPEAQRTFVDYASSQGWEYVLVDAGWNASWVPELVEYAADKGVGIWLWERWQNLDSPREHRERLGRWKEWGVVGVKVDFTESDGQDRMRWFDAVLASSADYQLMVNLHGGTIPRGTERTWPHLMSVEAVKGAENIKPRRGKEPMPPRHYVTLAYTRNLQGPMDFTPVTFTAVREISAGHELALAVLYESGVQHLADSVASYQARPLAEELLKVVPAVWDDTRLLSGDPHEHVVLARRHEQDWFVAAGFAGRARTVKVPLTFLGEGDWTARIYADASDYPHDSLSAETRQVTASDTIDVKVAKNGGFTIHLTPAAG